MKLIIVSFGSGGVSETDGVLQPLKHNKSVKIAEYNFIYII